MRLATPPMQALRGLGVWFLATVALVPPLTTAHQTAELYGRQYRPPQHGAICTHEIDNSLAKERGSHEMHLRSQAPERSPSDCVDGPPIPWWCSRTVRATEFLDPPTEPVAPVAPRSGSCILTTCP